MKTPLIRKDINGLRGLAILAVILYHLNLENNDIYFFSGGFVGVDIFFVISGYLIALVLFKELAQNNTISITNFYIKRMRKVLPSLFFVIVATSIFSWFFILPNSFENQSKSIISTIFFVSNFFYYIEGRFVDEFNVLSFFWHTWSLSLQLQFYIIFPIVILLCSNFFKNKILFILIIFCITSFLIAEYGSMNSPVSTYYFLPTRVWELLIGSIFAKIEIDFEKIEIFFFEKLIPITCLFLITFSIFAYSDRIFNPSIEYYPIPSRFILVPTIATIMIIYFNNKKNIINKILSINILQGIGTISYPLYLWHFVVFSISKKIGLLDNEIDIKIILFFFTFLISIFTYFFIEKKFLFKSNDSYNIKDKIYLLLLGIMASVIFIFSVNNIYNNGKASRLNTNTFLNNMSVNIKNINSAKSENGKDYNEECKFITYSFNDVFYKKFKKCFSKYDNFIFILGDSQAIEIFNATARYINHPMIIGVASGGCRPADNKKSCHYEDALNFFKKYSGNISLIIYNQRGSYFLTDTSMGKFPYSVDYRKLPIRKNVIKKTDKYLLEIKNYGIEIIWLGIVDEPNIKLTNKLAKNLNNVKQKYHYDNSSLIKINEILKNSNIEYVSIIDLVNFNLDEFYLEKKLTYSDSVHWTSFGEKFFGKKIVEKTFLKNIVYKD